MCRLLELEPIAPMQPETLPDRECAALLRLFEWSGSLLGLLGAYLLATNTALSQYGWLAFFIANVAMISYAYGIKSYGLLTQQVGFLGSSLLGLYRCGLFYFLT